MLKTTLAAAVAIGLTASALVSSSPAVSQKPSVGESAPEIDAPVWFNHIGKPPTSENLRGHAILVEFWATY